MADQSQQERAEGAHTRQEYLVELCRNETRQWPTKALLLFAAKEGKDWKLHGYGSFAEWLTSLNVGIAVSTANSLVAAYRFFHVERGVPLEELGEYDFTLVREVMPAVRRGDADVEEALADCGVLPRSDLRAKYAGGGGGEPEWCECIACGHRHPSKKKSTTK